MGCLPNRTKDICMTTLHYASGGSASQVATAGFNLVDVSSVDELNALPAGTKGLVWLDEANGATSSFIQKVTPFIGNKAHGLILRWSVGDRHKQSFFMS